MLKWLLEPYSCFTQDESGFNLLDENSILYLSGAVLMKSLKALMPITFSGLNRKYFFSVSNESPYFPHYNPKISTAYTFEVIAENVPDSGISILIFLCIFPVSHICFCPRRENISKLEVELRKI